MEQIKQEEMEMHRKDPQSLVDTVCCRVDKSFVESYENNHKLIRKRDVDYTETIEYASQLSRKIKDKHQASPARLYAACTYFICRRALYILALNAL